MAAADVGISIYPGQNLIKGDLLVMECRVTGAHSRTQEEAAVWYKESFYDDEDGEIVSYDNIKVLDDERITLEKTVFEDLSIYKLQIRNIKVDDGGRYSCDIHNNKNENLKQNVMVSVFEREQSQQDASSVNHTSFISFSDDTHDDTTRGPVLGQNNFSKRKFGHQPSWQNIEVIPSKATSIFLHEKNSKNVFCIILYLILLPIII